MDAWFYLLTRTLDNSQVSRYDFPQEKNTHKGCFFLVDDQGLEADGQGAKAGGIRHKSIKMCDVFAPLRRNMRP